MIAVAYYLLKVLICSGILFFYYYIALRNKIFHQWNRFYLLLAVMISLIVPIVQLTILHRVGDQASRTIQLLQVVQSANDFLEEVTITTHHSITMAQWLLVGYSITSAIFFFSLLFSLLKIFSLIKSHVVRLIGSIKFVNTNEPGTPFSFFHFIFWNNNIDLQSETGQQIFQHELVHVNEKHTWDKIFMQVVLIIFWCNPFFWLIRREIKLIHEFIADQKAVGQQGTEAFAAMLLQSAYPQQFHSITNQFFQTSIKRRLSMLMKIHNPKINYLSRILAMPVLAFIVLAFTVKTKTVHTSNVQLDKAITVVVDAGHGMMTNGNYNGANSGDVYEDDITLAIARQVLKENNNKKIRIILTRTLREDIDLKSRIGVAEQSKADLFISIHLNAMPPIHHTDGRTEEDISKNGFSVMASDKNLTYQKQSNVLASVLISELSSVYKTENKIQSRKIGVWVLDHNVCPSVIVECGFITNPDDKAFITKEENQIAVAQKILAAIERYASSQQSGSQNVYNDTLPKKINGKEIKSVNVNNKLKKVTVTFGDGTNKIFSMDEAVKEKIITYNPNQKEGIKNTQQEKGNINYLSKPLYIVNGKEFNGNLNDLNTNNIESVSVLKDTAALAKYGERGKNGVIEIKTKKTPGETQNISKDKELFFTKPEVEASIDKTEWQKYLTGQLQKFIENAASKGMAPGQYTANVRFLVDKNGNISDVKTLNDPGYGFGKAAEDVVRKGPKWEPALQNGKKVRSYHTQPITFVMSEGK